MIIKFLKSPKTLIASFILSGLIGSYLPEIAKNFVKIGDIYLSLLSMSILPFLFATLVVSVAKMIQYKEKINIKKPILYFIGFLLCTSFLGMLFSHFLSFGSGIAKNPLFLDIAVRESKGSFLSVNITDALDQSKSLIDIFKSIFPSNIFKSLQDGLVLQVIFFAIFIGCSTVALNDQRKEQIINLFSSLEIMMKKIIAWVMTILPIGIIFMFSPKFLDISGDILAIFINAVIGFIMIMIFLIMLINLYVSKKFKIGYFKTFSMMKDVILISATTGSAIATMPTYIDVLSKSFKLNSEKIDLFTPLTLSTCRFSSAFYFGFWAMLTAQIFSIPIEIDDWINMLVLTTFVSFAATSSGIVNLALFPTILLPIGVPYSLAITLYAAFDIVIDPFRTVFNFYANLLPMSMSIEQDSDK